MLTAIALIKEGKLLKDLPVEKIKKILKNKKAKIWLHIEQPTEEEFQTISNVFHLHPLEIEDCKKHLELPKIDEFEDHLFLVFHRFSYDFQKRILKLKELDIFIGKNYIVTFPNEPSDLITNLMKEQEKNTSLLEKGVDFVLYEIMDRVVKDYIPILDFWDEEIEKLEDDVVKGNVKRTMKDLFRIKRDIRKFKKSIGPQREVLNKLSHHEVPFISDKVKIYFRDVYDQIFMAYSLVEDQRDMITTIFEAYLSAISNKLNEIMKTLTIIATIFMPLTFIVGVYGMNFHYMPELEWPFGYYLVWFVMITIAILMLAFFKKREWI
ncbi:MAG: magnesium/cobalt transporter CorA [Candidatus Aenigmatarchaeota archaeon]